MVEPGFLTLWFGSRVSQMAYYNPEEPLSWQESLKLECYVGLSPGLGQESLS
jgi:hypothetical protein